MPSLTITGFVTRAELSLADLPLNDDTYKVTRPGFSIGEKTWARQEVESPYVHGKTLVAARLEQVTSILGIRVTGSTAADCMTKVETLTDAFSQFSYELSMTIEGTTYRWLCDPADYIIGDSDGFQPFHIRAFKQEVRLSIPRQPIPVTGPA